jgi:Protein of unknown function (DUF3168)
MPSANWPLQQALFAKLTGDASVLASLGGPRVYDDVPQGAEFPYLTFAQSTLRDWSTATESGEEHVVTLHAWSHARGRAQVHAIMSAARDALHEQPLSLDGHRLVNLRHEMSEARRDPDGETYRGLVRFRAVTEPE